MKCPYCNSNINKSRFCSECGKDLETGLTEQQKHYLKRQKTAHNVGAVAGSVVGGAGMGFGILSIIGGGLLIIFGFLLCLTIIGAIIGIPMILAGAGMLGIGSVSTVAGGVGTGVALHSAKKSGEISDKLHGVRD